MKETTALIHTGLNKPATGSPVNVPVHRSSTIVYKDLQSYINRFDNSRRYHEVTYAATGSSNSRALAQAVTKLETGLYTIVTATGLSACTISLGALVSSGDHILVTDSVYGPSRQFCKNVLSRYGVQTEFYNPAIGADIKKLCKPNTKLVFLEAPGSLTFEMQDVPAITNAAHECGVLVAMDNTWATPLAFKPLQHGVDISIQAGTKYIAGHSDLVIGLVTTSDEELAHRLADHAMTLGDVASPDDCYLALRGLRTLALRVPKHFESAMLVANWLQQRPEVQQVLYPPLDSDPGHALWQRDFAGGASLFGLVLKNDNLDAIARMIDGYSYFRIGSSWGGFESLVAVNIMPLARDIIPWEASPVLLRFHIGLEDPQDLIDDLTEGFDRLAQT